MKIGDTMCELNPKQTLLFNLEVFTSINMTKEEFQELVVPRLVAVENLLNADGRIRVHIHEKEEQE
jgi:hypothetical protein